MIDLELAKNLTLALAYLTSWNESTINAQELLRTWIGYDFDTLKKLEEENYIYGNKPGNKSFYITQEGKIKAKEILDKISCSIEKIENIN